ncbi:MAG: hypothetical protein U0575_03840 [Phycisphaerales bacterium]
MIERSERCRAGVDGSPTTIVKMVLADAGFLVRAATLCWSAARGRLAVSPWAGRARRAEAAAGSGLGRAAGWRPC